MKDQKKMIVETAKKGYVKEAVVDTNRNNRLGFLIIGIALLVLICCGIYWAYKGDTKETLKTDAVKFQEEYTFLNGKKYEGVDLDYLEISIPSNNPMKYADSSKILNIFENGTGVIYFGFPECPWCRNLVPSLLEAAKNMGIETIYYYNAKEDRDELELDEKNQVVVKKEGTEAYQKFLQELDNYLSTYTLKDAKDKEVKTDRKRLYFPTVVVVKEGKIVGFHEGTVESQENPMVKLTDEENKKLVSILEGYMQEMITCGDAC